MMKKEITILFLCFVGFVYGQQTVNYPDFSDKSYSSLIQDSFWKPLVKVESDLNNNKEKDIVLVLESKDSVFEKRIGQRPRKSLARILLVVVDDKVVVQNNAFIARGDEGGMLPYLEPELSFNKKQLTIYYQYTRGNQSYTFEMINDSLYLVQAESNHVHAASGNTESYLYNFRKRELTITKGNVSSDSKQDKKEVFKLKKGLKKLSELNEMYQWEVLKGQYL